MFHRICKVRRSLPIRFTYGWTVMQRHKLPCSLRTGFPLNLLEVNYLIYYMIIFVIIIYDLAGSIQKVLVNLSFIPARWFIITISAFDIHKSSQVGDHQYPQLAAGLYNHEGCSELPQSFFIYMIHMI